MPWRWTRLLSASGSVRAGLFQHERAKVSKQFPSLYRNQVAVRRLSSTSYRLNQSAAQKVINEPAESHLQALDPKFSKASVLLSGQHQLNVTVKVAGIVRSVRKHKKVAFVDLDDGSTYKSLQAALETEQAKDIQNGAYVELQGIWKASPAKGQKYELAVDEVLRIGECDPEESPIQKKSQTVDHLRSYPHLRLRTPLYSLLARARNTAIGSVHEFYSGSNSSVDEAVYVQPPLITSSDCEGAGEVFTITPKNVLLSENGQPAHYFRTPKYLTVSSQLHLEAFSAELGDVWTLSPAFRAEESDTARHLAELTMLEAEFRSITELEDLTARTQRLIQHIMDRFARSSLASDLLQYYIDDEYRPEGSPSCRLGERWRALEGVKWQHITYNDAFSELEAAARMDPSLFKMKPNWQMGLQLEHEKWLTQYPGGNKPLFVTHYPKMQKPFYMLPSSMTDNEDVSQTVACFDLLFPHGTCEVVGGSLREHRLEHLVTNMRQKGLLATNPGQDNTESKVASAIPSKGYPYLQEGESLNSLVWYADLRRFGSSPHGGFGLGFDRLLMYLTGVNNVRDIVGFPRTFGRADC